MNCFERVFFSIILSIIGETNWNLVCPALFCNRSQSSDLLSRKYSSLSDKNALAWDDLPLSTAIASVVWSQPDFMQSLNILYSHRRLAHPYLLDDSRYESDQCLSWTEPLSFATHAEWTRFHRLCVWSTVSPTPNWNPTTRSSNHCRRIRTPVRSVHKVCMIRIWCG